MPEGDVQGAAGQLDYLFRKPSCLVLLHETNVEQVFFRAGNLSDLHLDLNPKYLDDDPSFIVLTETKFSFRCIPVWDWYSPHRTRVEKKSTCDNALTVA